MKRLPRPLGGLDRGVRRAEPRRWRRAAGRPSTERSPLPQPAACKWPGFDSRNAQVSARSRQRGASRATTRAQTRGAAKPRNNRHSGGASERKCFANCLGQRLHEPTSGVRRLVAANTLRTPRSNLEPRASEAYPALEGSALGRRGLSLGEHQHQLEHLSIIWTVHLTLLARRSAKRIATSFLPHLGAASITARGPVARCEQVTGPAAA